MRKAIYFPALSCATTTYLAKTDEELKTNNIVRSPRFYNKQAEDNTYFHHPYSLWSAAHHYKIPNLREAMQIEKDSLIFIDSGGYQLVCGTVSEKNYNNQIALEWSENNGDLFPILDRPLAKGCDVQTNLDLSIDAARYYADNRSVDGTSILNVMSARNEPEMEHWYGSIKDFPFEGWAHGGHKGNMKSIIQGILFLLNKKEYDRDHMVYHHVFGISRMDAMIYFAVIQKILNEMDVNIQLTYDSSYFQRNFAFGGYFLFPTYTGIQQIQLSNKFDYSKISQDKHALPCLCPICSNIGDIKEFFDDTMDFYLLGILHNLKLMLNYKHAVESIIAMDIQGIIDASFPAKFKNNIKVIKEAFANPTAGGEIIKRKFEDKEITFDDAPASLDSFFGN